MGIKLQKFKLNLSLEKSVYLAIACMSAVNKTIQVTIKDFLNFTQFIMFNHSTSNAKTSENFVTSLLAKMVKQNKLFCEVKNDLNHYSINKDTEYWTKINAIPQIVNNLKSILNNYRIMQDKTANKKQVKQIQNVITSTAQKSTSKIMSYKLKTSKKRIVITNNLLEKIFEVVAKNPNGIRVSDRKNPTNTIVGILEQIKPNGTDKKDFKSAINSLLFKNNKLFRSEKIGNDNKYYRLWYAV